MSSRQYKGDTHGKRIARATLWNHAVHMTWPKRPWESRCAYLASHEGGDASCLYALGTLPENQLAVDVDAAALASFSQMYPEVPTHLGDVRKFFEERSPKAEKFDVIFLDFCSYVTPTLLAAVRAAAKHVRHRGVLAVAFQRGREDEVTRARLSHQYSDRSKTGSPADEIFHRLYDGRSEVVRESLDSIGKYDRMVCSPMLRITYQSRTKRGPGTPMGITAFSVERFPEMNRTEFLRNQLRLSEEFGNTMSSRDPQSMVVPRCYALGSRSMWLSSVMCGRGMAYDFTWIGPNEVVRYADRIQRECLSRAVLEFGVSTKRELLAKSPSFDERRTAAMMVNLTTSELSAMRAHWSRGSYKSAADDSRARALGWDPLRTVGYESRDA